MSQRDNIEFLKSIGIEVDKPEQLNHQEFLRSIGINPPQPIVPDPVEANPQQADFDAIRKALSGTQIDIGVPVDNSAPFAWIGRLIGLEQGMRNVEVSDSYQEFSTAISEAEENGSLMARVVANHMKRAQGQALAGGAAVSVADFEERPRKAVVNSLAVLADARMKGIQGKSVDPLTVDDFTQAITDAWNGEQRTRTMSAVRGATLPRAELWYQRLKQRHPKFAKVADAKEAVDELGIMLLSEFVIAKGVGAVGKGAKGITGSLLKVSKPRYADSLQDLILRTAKETAASEGDDILTSLVKRLDEEVELDLEEFRKFEGFKVKPTVGVETPDDLVKSIIYKRFIEGSVVTKDNPAGWIDQKNMQKIIDAATFRERNLKIIPLDEPIVKVIDGKEVTQTTKAVTKSKSLRDLTFEQLEDLALEVDSIKDMDINFRKSWLAQVGRSRFSISPPARIFENLGLGREYAQVASGLYDTKSLRHQDIKWYVDAQRGFRKLTQRHSKAVWNNKPDNKVNRIWGRVMDGSPQSDWPDDLIDVLNETEIEWFAKLATDNQDVSLNPFRDEAIRQGIITNDPDLIAAGVPPAVDNYYHRGRRNIIRSVEERRIIDDYSGKFVKDPLRWDVKDLVNKETKTDFNYTEFLNRTGSEDQIIYRGIGVDMQSKQEVARMLYVEPHLKKMNAAIEALPDGLDSRVKREARTVFAAWVKQIRHQPLEIDESLNRIFNAGSRQLEKISKRYESSEKAFTNFAKWSNKWTNRSALLGNLRPILRNPFQTQHTFHIYGPKSGLWGLNTLFTKDGQALVKTSQTFMSRGVPIASIDMTNAASVKSAVGAITDKATYGGIMVTDKYFNVAHAYITGWHSYFSKNQRAWGDLVRHGKTIGVTESALRNEKFASTLTHALQRGKFLEARRTIDFKGVALTQWLYDTEMATPVMRSMAARLGLKWTLWQQNLFGGHLPTLMDQLLDPDTSKPLRLRVARIFDPRKGKGGVDIFNMPATLTQRTAILQAIGKVGLAVYLGEKAGVKLIHLTLAGSTPSGRINLGGRNIKVPAPVSPVTRGVFGVAQGGINAITDPIGTAKGSIELANRDLLYAIGQMQMGELSDDAKMAQDGYRNFVGAMTAHIGGFNLARKLKAIEAGKMPASGILWPTARTGKPTISRTIRGKGVGISEKKLGIGDSDLGL